MTAAHSGRAHALLSASSASRWIACPPSARLTESVPDRSSEFAQEGTLGHELAEAILSPLERAEVESLRAHPLYTKELESAVREWVAVVEQRFAEARELTPDAVMLLEQRLDFSRYVPEGYGTGDVVIIADGVLDVMDLKLGKGVPVSAVGNAQMRLYGLGALAAWSFLYDLREVRMTIVQPRLASVSTEVLSAQELTEWGERVVVPAAALAFEGGGEFAPGEHCRWCRVKATCRARAEVSMAALGREFKDPSLLSDAEIGPILFVAEQLATWAKDVQDYAFERAKSGHEIPLWKLVEGRSNRAIIDEEGARERLKAAGFEAGVVLKPQKLLGIGDLEKVVGKKELASILGELVQKPPGKPVLVPETDKRAAVHSVEQEFADVVFED